MNGKINIVFGFFYLAFTAALGQFFLVPQLEGRGKIMKETSQAVAEVRSGMEQGIEADKTLVAKHSKAIVNTFDALKSQHTKGDAAHSHGNLEALLNIVAGFIILALILPAAFKAILSSLFILGTLFHSGMLYLGTVFSIGMAFKLLPLGAMLLVASIALMGVAAAIGIKNQQKA